MKLGDKIIVMAVGAMIAITLVVQVQRSIASAVAPEVVDCGLDEICGGANSADDVVTSVAGVFNGTATGSLMTLIPLIIIAGVLGYVYLSKDKK